MKEIPLPGGRSSLVDDADYEMLAQHRWQVSNGYAVRFKRKHETENFDRFNRELVAMHRLIVNAPPGMDVDHINQNRLDNRRENLRVVTRGGNMRNKAFKGSKTGYRGVTRRSNRWEAKIKDGDGFPRYLGAFRTAERAALAYNDALDEIDPQCPVKNDLPPREQVIAAEERAKSLAG